MLFLFKKLKYDKLLESHGAGWYLYEELILQWGKTDQQISKTQMSDGVSGVKNMDKGDREGG